MGLLRQLIDLVKASISGKDGGSRYKGRDVKPASEDPYGDPADQVVGRAQGTSAQPGNFGNVKPASEDPYGDPADQKR